MPLAQQGQGFVGKSRKRSKSSAKAGSQEEPPLYRRLVAQAPAQHQANRQTTQYIYHQCATGQGRSDPALYPLSQEVPCNTTQETAGADEQDYFHGCVCAVSGDAVASF